MNKSLKFSLIIVLVILLPLLLLAFVYADAESGNTSNNGLTNEQIGQP